MLIRTLYFEQATIIAAVVCSLIVAGLLKGIIGVGMPVVALPLLSLFIDIKSAAMLLSMPSSATCRRRWSAERLDDTSCN
jgi:uncharacterized membrane protein YfcA